jgi:plastocyanin
MNMRRYIKPWMLLTGVAVVALLVLVACGGSSGGGGGSSTPVGTPTSASGGGSAVSIANFAFSPQTLTVKAGTTVTWTNNDGAPHSVASTDGPSTSAKTTGVFDSGNLGAGQTFSFTFDKAGTYYYDCTIHAAQASMHGTVIVT